MTPIEEFRCGGGTLLAEHHLPLVRDATDEEFENCPDRYDHEYECDHCSTHYQYGHEPSEKCPCKPELICGFMVHNIMEPK